MFVIKHNGVKERVMLTKGMEPQSPLRCLNLPDPSPIKKLPVLLRNPFNKPVKRRLNLGRSPNKKTRMLGMDEDANLEPPKMKQTTPNPCYLNDWTLRTKVRIGFTKECKNWNSNSISTHKRRTGQAADNTPTKMNDKSISIDAIKNLSTVYQHPYLPWKRLYPRTATDFDKKTEITLSDPQVMKMMHKDWCESLSDLANLLIDGRCPYFYMCSDNYNILFKQVKPLVQAYISPFFYGMGCELTNIGVEFSYPDQAGSESPSMGRSENSQVSSDSTDEDEDTSQFLESLGLSQQVVCPSLQGKRKCFIEADSKSSTKTTSYKPLALVEGAENLRKLVKFLHTNQLYTINNVGKFACIPPTLLSPHEFRLSTPQYPEVVLSEKNNEFIGPTYIQLQGTILPNSYVELHKLLTISDNTDHTCQSTPLVSSLPFKDIKFN